MEHLWRQENRAFFLSCVLACICLTHIFPLQRLHLNGLLRCNVYLSSSAVPTSSLPLPLPPACSVLCKPRRSEATLSTDAAEESGRGGGEADVSPNGRRVSEPPTDFSCFGRLIGAEFKGAGGESVKSPEGLLNAERKLDDGIARCIF